jgi:hypothetical protein
MKALTPDGPKPVIREIVGVIRQVKVKGLNEKQNSPEIHVSIAESLMQCVDRRAQLGAESSRPIFPKRVQPSQGGSH